jgi:hypothetical protein
VSSNQDDIDLRSLDADVGEPSGDCDQSVLIGRVREGWVVSAPLIVRIERDDAGRFLVSDDVFAVHGDGDTRDQAVKDYVESLIEYHELLADRAENHEPTKAMFLRLRRYLKRSGE